MHERAQCSKVHHLYCLDLLSKIKEIIGVEHTESEQSIPQLDLALPLTIGKDLGKFSNSEHENNSF